MASHSASLWNRGFVNSEIAYFGFFDWKEYEVQIETKLYQLLEKVPHHAPAYATLRPGSDVVLFMCRT